jgi:hypothetical protein
MDQFVNFKKLGVNLQFKKKHYRGHFENFETYKGRNF